MGTIFQKEADPAKPPLLTEGKIEKPVDYREQALDKYKKKFEEFEYRCERAAFMNYKTSSDYDRYSQNLEHAAVTLGLLSAGLWLASTSEAGKKGVRISKFAGPLTIGASILMEIFAKGNLIPGILPTLRVRAERHTNAAAGWQKLALEAREYLIRLESNDPDLCPKTCSQWYRDFLKERKDVCTAAIVPQKVHETFKAKKVYKWQKDKQDDYENYEKLKEGENSDKADLSVPINWASDRCSEMTIGDSQLASGFQIDLRPNSSAEMTVREEKQFRKCNQAIQLTVLFESKTTFAHHIRSAFKEGI